MSRELGARLSDEDLVAVIYSELERTVDYATTSLKENRRKAWDYYFNRPRGDEVEGRSKVQDTTVRDTVHALLATIMPAYATDTVISFEAMGPDDQNQAEAESRAVNNLFTETNQGYLELYNAVADTLLFRNGVIKVWVEDKEEVTHREFAAEPAAVLAQAPEGEDWEHVSTDEDGVARFRITSMRQSMEIEAIEQGAFYVDPNQPDQQLQNAGILAERTFFTRSELLQMGIPRSLVEDLPATPDIATSAGTGSNTVDQTAKFIDGLTDVIQGATADRETVECHWVHMPIDLDGDGISEKYRFLVSNNELLLQDPVDYFPYASGAAWPVPHRWSAQSVYDLAHITQDERTNARRQFADNMNFANNQRPVYDPAETIQEDVNTGAPGRGIRSTNPSNVGWMPFADIAANSVHFLQYMDKVRSEQTGAALEMASPEGQLVTQASGISADIQLAPREQMAAMCSRNIAETLVRNVFLLVHQTLRTEWRSPIMFERAGEWTETHPADWPARTRLNVAVGLSPGERRRQLSALDAVFQKQLALLQGGAANIAVDWPGIHAALTDWNDAAELDGSQGYFLDPDSQGSQQALQAAAEQQQEQGQVMAALQQVSQQLEQAKLDLDKYKHDTQLTFDRWEALLDARVKYDEIEQKNTGPGDAAGSGQGSGRENGAANPRPSQGQG